MATTAQITALGTGLSHRLAMDYYETDDDRAIVAALLAEQDREGGWTIDVQRPDQQSAVREENVYLTPDELTQALKIARGANEEGR